MAATDARPVPRKNVAYRVTFPILDADGDLVTAAATLDSEVSIDAGTFADCTNEATEIATGSGVYYLDLTAAEMNGDTVAVIVKTGTAGAKTTTIVMYPEEVGDYRADMVQISGDTTAADNLETAFDDTAGPVQWLGVIDQGTAQSATATTVVLRAASAFGDNTLIGATILVHGSTQGYWQTRTITDHVLATDTATVDTFDVTPTGTITYKIFAGAPASATNVPAVNVTQFGGVAGTFSGGRPEVNTTHAAGTAWGSGAITAASIAADAITAAKIADSAIDAGSIATGAITSAKFAAGAIDAAAIATGAVDADALATDAVNEIADGILDRNMATGTDSGSATVRTVRQALRFLRNKWSISAGTLTVTKEDDTTASWTGAVTTAAGNPVDSVDPASV